MSATRYLRTPTLLLAAFAVNAVLFGAIQYMVVNRQMRLADTVDFEIANFIRVQVASREVRSRRDPKAPSKPDSDTQEMLNRMSAAPTGGTIGGLSVDVPKVDIEIDTGGAIQIARELTPLVRVLPVYPERARANLTEGYVTLRFTVTETGAVADPEVIASEPPGYFDRYAIRAVLKWKYQPQLVDGKPVSVVTYTRVNFQMAPQEQAMRGPLIALTVWCTLVWSHAALAQSITRSTFKVVTHVQTLMEEERFEEALAMLEVLVEDTRDIPYDHAIANQYLAHNSVMLDRIDRGRTALARAVATPDLPPQMAMELRLFYGSVLLGEEDFALAAQMLEAWFALAEAPKPKQIFKVGYANYMNGNPARASDLLREAINAAGDKAETSWLQVYYRVLFDLKRYREAETIVYRLIEREPDKAMPWRMLASHHLQLDRNDDALAALMVSYLGGQIRDGDDLQQIASLFSFLDVPDKAARLLEAWTRDGRIEKDAAVAKQLGNLWLVARERDKAKSALQEAARMAPDSEIYDMLGSVYFEDENWADAYAAFSKALAAGGARDTDRLALLAGISAMRAELDSDARRALQAATTSKKYGQQANALLTQLDEKH